jgi:hypothetical protein
MRICQLTSNHDFRPLHLPRVLAGDETARINHQFFSGPAAIGGKWTPPEVCHLQPPSNSSAHCCEPCGVLDEHGTIQESQLPAGDFPHCWGLNFGVLGQRAFHVLKELIAPYVEFLPLVSHDGDFTAFKVLRFVDALDLQKSKIDWVPQRKQDNVTPRIVREVKRFVFDEKLLVNEIIFRIPQLSTGIKVFVTEAFMQVVKAHNLTGFRFTQVWPSEDQQEVFMRKRLRKHK